MARYTERLTLGAITYVTALHTSPGRLTRFSIRIYQVGVMHLTGQKPPQVHIMYINLVLTHRRKAILRSGTHHLLGATSPMSTMSTMVLPTLLSTMLAKITNGATSVATEPPPRLPATLAHLTTIFT